MSHPYFNIAFTPAVRALQERDGSGEHYAGVSAGPAALSEREASFIEAADHFFQATVSETGWPYVQHRGGPPGFLKVVDAHTIGFADLRGNRQFISVGNLSHDGRVALILMDWVAKRRLKLMGRVRVVEASADPELLAQLAVPGYGKPERAWVITIEGYDWNCPQHITQRYTRASVDLALAPLHARIAALEAQLAARG